jgi:hypothetical protein
MPPLILKVHEVKVLQIHRQLETDVTLLGANQSVSIEGHFAETIL